MRAQQVGGARIPLNGTYPGTRRAVGVGVGVRFHSAGGSPVPNSANFSAAKSSAAVRVHWGAKGSTDGSTHAVKLYPSRSRRSATVFVPTPAKAALGVGSHV